MSSEFIKPLVLGTYVTPSHIPPRVFELMGQTGGNTGNLLFATAASEILESGSPRIAPHNFRAAQAAGHDCIVLAAANWLSPSGDFNALSAELEATQLPVIALGLGAQAGLDRDIPVLHPGARRLVALLADRSPLIAARGRFSVEVLAHYGAENAVATGCPSLLMSRGRCPEFRRTGAGLLKPEEVVLHSTRHKFNGADAFHGFLYREAFRAGYDLLLQSETADFFFTEGRNPKPQIREQAMSCLTGVYQAPAEEIARYLGAYGRGFFRVEDWLAYYRSKRFVFGTRIHGTIAAILSGTPALLVAHDARTVELAETMGIPFVLKGEVDVTRPLDLERYYAQALAHDFASGYARYWETFRDFFTRTGLQTNLYG